MLKFRSLLGVRGVGMALFFSAIYPGIAAERQVLHGHVPAAVVRFNLQPTGQLPATKSLHLAIGLPLRNEAALDKLLQQIYDPASPNFHRYLTPEQFTEQFGPTEQDYQKVIAFAKRNGLTVTGTSANRVLLDVSGSVADIEKAFQVTMLTYRHPTEARDFFAPDTEPTVDAALPVVDIQGLSDFSRPHPKLVKRGLANAMPKSGSAPDGSGNYFGNDFRNAYVPGTTLTGAGQMVGLLEFDGFYASDIAAYATAAGNGRTNIPVQAVLIDGVSGTPGYSGIPGANDEVSLDIEMVIAMAPGLAKVVVYEGGSLQNDVLNTMVAASNTVKNLSSSWGWSGGPSTTTDSIFKNMATVGQSFFNASGDSDAFTTGASSVNGVDNTSLYNAPSSSPYITQVGGTTLTMNGTGASYASETVWNWGYDSNAGGYVGSSGGISSYYSIPSWQTNVNNMAGRGGSTSFRNIPDVALTADNVFVYYGNGSSEELGGTSCAAPLWAGFTALVNQQAVASGRATVGFVNPAIYTIGQGANYAVDFHDITTGNNTWPSSPANFYAVPGYDLCTGWGTPAGQNLINALAGPPDTLGILPGTGFTSSGPVGGPFTVTSQNFSLTNSGGTSLNWSLTVIPSWLNVSSGGGTLASHGNIVVTVSLNSTASNLLAGIYAANLVFTNMTSGIAQSRQFTLQVGQPLLQNGGFETGDFSFWTLNGDGGNYNFVDNGTFITPHSGNYAAALGELGFLAYLSQSIPTFAGQSYLLSLWMDSPKISGTTTPNEFSVSWNGGTIFDQTNVGKIGWTNLQFIVTATSSSTVLQFGFRDDPYYLGLDDISVTPIPVPAFRATTKTSNTFNLTWGTMTGLIYQVQYKTNLLQTNWINLGKPLIATNGNLTLSDTNAIGSSPQRFYRLMVSP
jgi:subtilase family serine protease